MFKLERETLTLHDDFGRYILAAGEVGEKEQHGQRIVEISQSINECGVALLNDMVEAKLGGEVALEP